MPHHLDLVKVEEEEAVVIMVAVEPEDLHLSKENATTVGSGGIKRQIVGSCRTR